MRSCTVTELKQKLREGNCRVLDVREPAEYNEEHVAGSELVPLSSLNPSRARALGATGDCVILCRSGVRSAQAAQKFVEWGLPEPRVLQGGLNSWTQSGGETLKGDSKVWGLERQVRFAAGALVLAGVALGAWVHPGFYGLAGFVGAGLVFAAVTNTCGMAMLLARMPWNAGCP